MRLWRHATDGLILLGAGLIVAGAWLIYPPIALILGGALLISIVILGGPHGPTH